MVLCLSRPSTYPFTESSLYAQATPSGAYYEDPPTPGSQGSTPATSQPVSVTTGFSGAGSGVTVVSGASSSGGGGGGAGAGVVAGGGAGSVSGGGVAGAYVVPGSYVMGSGGQNYTHNIRASPATVSTHHRLQGYTCITDWYVIKTQHLGNNQHECKDTYCYLVCVGLFFRV